MLTSMDKVDYLNIPLVVLPLDQKCISMLKTNLNFIEYKCGSSLLVVQYSVSGIELISKVLCRNNGEQE